MSHLENYNDNGNLVEDFHSNYVQ